MNPAQLKKLRRRTVKLMQDAARPSVNGTLTLEYRLTVTAEKRTKWGKPDSDLPSFLSREATRWLGFYTTGPLPEVKVERMT